MKSWDKFIIPKPFSKIDFYIGEPIDVLDMDIEKAKILIQAKMNENKLQK